MTGVTETLLHSDLSDQVELVHVDISDHRPIRNVARMDLVNVALAFWHGGVFLLRLLRKQPDLVYLPIARNRLGFLRDCLFLFPARVARLPTVVHFHSRAFSDYWHSESRWMQWLIRLAFGPRTYGIALAESLVDGFEPLLTRSHVQVVENGVPDIGVGEPAGSREPVVLHISTMWSEKGLFDVLEVARRVHSVRPAARFILAGAWYTQRERIRAYELIEQDGLVDCVRFAGHVDGDEKALLLKSAAVMLLPSKYEGQPLVVLEALAAGTPIVATRVGAIPETVREGREGFLADVGDNTTLTDRTIGLLDDSVLRDRFGASARRRYEQRHTPAVFGERLVSVLHAVLAADRGTGTNRSRMTPHDLADERRA